MDRRVILGFGAAIVVAGIAIAVLAMRADDTPPPAAAGSAPTKNERSTTVATARTETRRAERPPSSPADHNWDEKLAGRTPIAIHDDGSREYEIDGRRVRDYRKRKRTDDAPARPARRADGRELPTAVTQKVAQDLKTAVRECIASSGVVKPQLNKTARLVGVLKVTVRGGQLSVDPRLELQNLDDARADTLKQCVAEKARAMVAAAPNEADLDDYEMRVSLLL